MIERPGLLLFIVSALLIFGCGGSGAPGNEEASVLSWSSGLLEVTMSRGPAPLNVSEYQELSLEVTTGGTEPVIEIPGFEAGGFLLESWTPVPPLAEEDKTVYRYSVRLEPLRSGELFIPPMRILSGEEISHVVVTEGIRITVPSLFSTEELETAAEGRLPAVKPVEEEPVSGRRFVILIPVLAGAAAFLIILTVFLKRRKLKVPELTPSEASLRKCENLNPGDYSGFYSRAAEIIREAGDLAEGLKEILRYYELAAYTGRLSENSELTPRSPHADKAKMMVWFSQAEDDRTEEEPEEK